MELIATLASIASGFILMRYDGSPATVLATSVAINLALAPLTAVIAARRDRSGVRWLALGLAFGMWALAASLLIGARCAPAPSRPHGTGYRPPDDAA
jgi:hypothetical protein